MAENAPPASTSAPSNGAGTTTATASSSTTGGTSSGTDQNQSRGIPYYEKLRRDLRDTLQKKRMMDKSMAQLEEQIYRFEQSYLEETSAGNIIKGFDNYIKGASGGSTVGAGGLTITGSGGAGAARRKAQVSDQDRVFSRSSASFMRNLQSAQDSPAPSSAQTTPSHAPTPTSSHNGLASAGPNSTTKSGDGAVKSSGSSSSKNKKKSSGGGSAAARDGSNKEDDAADGGTDGAGTGDGSASKPPAKRLKITYGRD
ncbi:hypothetical protein VTN77DRAFT_8387 [Rasamsonia byssochlamydoides]|uniref:uncharacterized protein n=1 Tax=Rasamsonia byssochlamydoides TaxID=89139 RepID=UPI00374254CC